MFRLLKHDIIFVSISGKRAYSGYLPVNVLKLQNVKELHKSLKYEKAIAIKAPNILLWLLHFMITCQELDERVIFPYVQIGSVLS